MLRKILLGRIGCRTLIGIASGKGVDGFANLQGPLCKYAKASPPHHIIAGGKRWHRCENGGLAIRRAAGCIVGDGSAAAMAARVPDGSILAIKERLGRAELRFKIFSRYEVGASLMGLHVADVCLCAAIRHKIIEQAWRDLDVFQNDGLNI